MDKKTITGTVTSINVITTKLGRQMMFADVEEYDEKWNVIVFPDTWDNTQEKWIEGHTVTVSGTLSARDGRISIVCDNVI